MKDIEPALGLDTVRTLPWLIRLRWTAVLGQGLTVLGTVWWLRIPLPLGPIVACIAVTALSNVALMWVSVRWSERPGFLAAVMAADVLLLTVLLHQAGGPHNPFTSFYMVHVALAAVALPWPLALGVAAFCALGFAALFLGLPAVPRPGDAVCGIGPNLPLSLHLRGMLVAFLLTAGCVVAFAGRLQAALRRGRKALAQAQAESERHERFAGLATLAAGAAHELGSPLGTIQIAAAELARAATRHPEDSELAEDAGLIREEVTRCRMILDRLACQAEDPAETLNLQEVFAEVCGRFDSRSVDFCSAHVPEQFVAPRRALVQALSSLVKNGLDASAAPGRVRLEAVGRDGALEFAVTDQGAGLSADAWRHAGEPFFTTKPPGSGVGLGLFLVRLLSQRMGGNFELTPLPEGGTRAVLRVPLHSGLSA